MFTGHHRLIPAPCHTTQFNFTPTTPSVSGRGVLVILISTCWVWLPPCAVLGWHREPISVGWDMHIAYTGNNITSWHCNPGIRNLEDIYNALFFPNCNYITKICVLQCMCPTVHVHYGACEIDSVTGAMSYRRVTMQLQRIKMHYNAL